LFFLDSRSHSQEFLRLTPEQHEDHAAFLRIAKDVMPRVLETMERKIHTQDVVIPSEIVCRAKWIRS
jgi:hypothetical protein